MTPVRMMLGEEHVLPIELKLATWQTLPWSQVESTAHLLELRAKQLDLRNGNLEEAVSRQQRVREEANNYWESQRQARMRPRPLREGDLVLLHNTQTQKDFGRKLEFVWRGPYRVSKSHRDGVTGQHIGSYELEELDGAMAHSSIRGNRLRIFHQREATSHPSCSEESSAEEPEEGLYGSNSGRRRSEESIIEIPRDLSPTVEIRRPDGFDTEDYQVFSDSQF